MTRTTLLAAATAAAFAITASAPAEPAPTKTAVKPGQAAGHFVTEPHNAASDRQVVHKIYLEEAKLRKRQARIDRLRALAQEQGNAERLAALDRLEARMHALHARKAETWRARLGEKKFATVNDKLARGRGHGHAKGHAPDKRLRKEAKRAAKGGDGHAHGPGDGHAHEDGHGHGEAPASRADGKGKAGKPATFHGHQKSKPSKKPVKAAGTTHDRDKTAGSKQKSKGKGR